MSREQNNRIKKKRGKMIEKIIYVFPRFLFFFLFYKQGENIGNFNHDENISNFKA